MKVGIAEMPFSLAIAYKSDLKLKSATKLMEVTGEGIPFRYYNHEY